MKDKIRAVRIIGAFLFAALVLAGCSAKPDKGGGSIVVTVNDTDIAMDEMMYYIYLTEAQGNENESLYQAFFGESYWEETDENGKTTRELLKEDTMNQAVLYEILYQKALQAGYALEEEQQETIASEAEDFFNSLTEKQKKAMRIKKAERMNFILSKIAIAEAYYDDVMKDIEIDEETAVSGIYEEDYRQYDVEYLYSPTVSYEEGDVMIPYSQEEEKEAFDKLQPFLSRAQGGEDFDSLSEQSNGEIESGQISFLQGDELIGPAFEKAALTLSSGRTYQEIVKEEDGYYIIRMMDDNSRESYESEVEMALETARQEAFTEVYEEMKKDFEVKIHDEIWDPIVIGDLTLDEEAQSGEDGLVIEEGGGLE